MTKAKKKGLTFSPGNHQYRLDGKHVQGVTTLIKQGFPNDVLKYWSARLLAEYVADNPEQVDRLRQMGRGPMIAALKEVPWQYRDEAANKGTEIHGYAEQIVTGAEVDVPEGLVPYVESCIDFLEDYKIEPVLVEGLVGNRKHWYAGKLDLIANGLIWDYKTGGSGVWPETAFQLAGYANAEFYVDGSGDEQPLPEMDGAYGVWIRADGYDVLPLEHGPHVFEEFLAITEVARIAKRAKGDRNTPGYVGPALQPQEATA